jgi:hypothetical protein
MYVLRRLLCGSITPCCAQYVACVQSCGVNCALALPPLSVLYVTCVYGLWRLLCVVKVNHLDLLHTTHVMATLVVTYTECTNRGVNLCAGATATDDTITTEAADTPEGQIDDGRDSDEDHVQDVTEEGIEQESAAQVRYRQLTASGLYDVAEVPKMRNEGQDDAEGDA